MNKQPHQEGPHVSELCIMSASDFCETRIGRLKSHGMDQNSQQVLCNQIRGGSGQINSERFRYSLF